MSSSTARLPGPLRVITTADGSATLQQVDSGWTYRSTHGAVEESTHVFVEASRILQRGLRRPRVLEMGFGAGGNFAATVRAWEAGPAEQLRYCAVERAVVPVALVCFDHAQSRALAQDAVLRGRARRGGVSLELQQCAFEEFESSESFDAIYFDPFGPTQQPNSWTADVFDSLRPRLDPAGRLTTYAAAGWIRRNLAEAGFYVATAPGPAGKRHITVAAVTAEALAPLKIRNRP